MGAWGQGTPGVGGAGRGGSLAGLAGCGECGQVLMPEVPQRVGSRKYRVHPGPRALALGSPKHKAKTSAEAQHQSRAGDTELAAQVEARCSCLGDRGGRRGAGQQGQQGARPEG